MRPVSVAAHIVRWALALCVVALTAFASTAPAAQAQAVASGDATAATVASPEPADPTGEPDRWWGALGAGLCAFETRLAWRVPAVGMNPYVMAAGIGGCVLAAMDVFSTK